jgi:peptide/nickel transport system permease protein
MINYAVRRLLLVVPTLLLVTIIIFVAIRLIPGDVIDQMARANMATSHADFESFRQRITQELGLDVPIHVQYVRWISGVIRGDLGDSLWSRRPVIEEIAKRLPVSIQLGGMALLISLSISLPIGTYSAVRQDTLGDYIARSFAILCIAIPGFWLGTMVMVFPSIWWNWSPPIQYVSPTQDLLENLSIMIIPSAILGMLMSGMTMRMTRTMMLEVLRQDYIRTAYAKGLSERAVILGHAIKNALIPVITLIGLWVPILIGGEVIIEQIFVLPGIGRLLLSAATNRDYTMLSGVNLVLAGFILLTNILVDLTYCYLDPRVQYE